MGDRRIWEDFEAGGGTSRWRMRMGEGEGMFAAVDVDEKISIRDEVCASVCVSACVDSCGNFQTPVEPLTQDS